MILWKSNVETAKNSMHTLMIVNFSFWWSPKHWYFLLLQWCLVDDSLRKHLWNSDDFDANIIDHYGFYCAIFRNIDNSLLLLWWFVEATILKHWRISFNFQWPQMFRFNCANLRILDVSLMLQWCFVDASLREPLWNSNDLNANKNDHLRFFFG